MDFMPFEQSGHKCVVCGADNLLTFIDLTLVTSRTSQTDSPVRDILRRIIKHKWLDMSNFMILCSPCFNMVERYDQLESELLQIQCELSTKYIHTAGLEHVESVKEEPKRAHKLSGANEDQECFIWQQQVSVDILQPVVNLSADEDSGDDAPNASEDSSDDTHNKPNKKRKKLSRRKDKQEATVKDRRSSPGKPRGRPRKDPSCKHTPTPPPPQEEDPKNTTVYKYDHSYPFFKDGERLRTGQVINEESLSTDVQCIYCCEKRAEAKEINIHVWNLHKPQIVTTFVPSDNSCQQELNFGVQLVKVAMDSQVLGRPFMCIYCDATFKFKSNLLQHFRENHSPHKPFSCVECQAKFRRSIEVSRHRVYYCPNKKPIPGGRNDGRLPPPQ